MKRVTLKSIGKVIYCYMLPAMGTTLLIISMFNRELSGPALSPESDTMLKIIGLTLCASTYWAAFMYWNSFVREFQVVMDKDEFDAYSEHLYNMQSSDPDPDYDYEYGPEPEMEEVYPTTNSRVELDSPIKGLCLPFVYEYTEDWQKQKGGWGNGYVLISSDHPASGLSYDDEQTPYFECELTFAGQFSTEMLESCGIDKDIAEDADKYWVFGFDTMHVWNNPVTNDANWVASKAVQLAAEFKKAYIERVD
jgi:hypothetical protein